MSVPRAAALAAVLCVGGVVVAGVFLALTAPPNTVACFSGQPARGGELHTDLAMDPRIKSMELTVVINRVSGGAVRWSINDPKGDSKWGGRTEAAGTYTSGPLPASGGTWKVNLISDADELDYRIEWKSLDPAASRVPTCGAPA